MGNSGAVDENGVQTATTSFARTSAPAQNTRNHSFYEAPFCCERLRCGRWKAVGRKINWGNRGGERARDAMRRSGLNKKKKSRMLGSAAKERRRAWLRAHTRGDAARSERTTVHFSTVHPPAQSRAQKRPPRIITSVKTLPSPSPFRSHAASTSFRN